MPQPGASQAWDRFAYSYNNPILYTDPSGHWIETAWDIANIAWDIYEVKNDPSFLNVVALVVDVTTAVAPLVPAGVGVVVRASKAAKIANEVVTNADEVVDAYRGIDKLLEEGKLAEKIAPEGFRRWVYNEFRENLMRLTGKTASEVGQKQAHYMLPKQFRQQFSEIGFNINDPRFGA